MSQIEVETVANVTSYHTRSLYHFSRILEICILNRIMPKMFFLTSQQTSDDVGNVAHCIVMS